MLKSATGRHLPIANVNFLALPVLNRTISSRPGHAIARMTAFLIAGPEADRRKTTHFSRSKSLRTPRVGNSFATS